MADVKMPKMPKSKPCKFYIAWSGKCGKPTTNGWCSEHEKAKCSSCKKKATRSCDAQMGGLTCGADLCATCQHSEGRHVTKAVYNRLESEQRLLEKEGIESERMLSERGVPIGLPKHLLELLSGDKSGYEIKEIYALSLEHGLMGYFPAVFVEKRKRIIITSDPSLIFRVWESLEPRKSRLDTELAWVNESLSICYLIKGHSEHDKLTSRPHRLLNEEEHRILKQDGAQPYRWAPGLFGGSDNESEVRRKIASEAKQHGVVLASSTP
jgi:hypothetical protein